MEIVTAYPLERQVDEGFQGMAISGNTLVSLQNQGYARLYELPSMKALTDTFRLGSFSQLNHANVAAFGVEKFSREDRLPLLYVSQAHRKSWDGLKNVCFVERILPEGKATLVQRIVLDDIDRWYGYALQWTVDRRHKLLVGFGNTVSNDGDGNRFRVMLFRLPKLADGAIVHLKADDALNNYLLQDFDSRYPSKVVGQGACVRSGCLWMPTGFGDKSHPSVVYVWDLRHKRLRDIIDLQDVMPHELEDIDFYKGHAYVQTNGAGIIVTR